MNKTNDYTEVKVIDFDIELWSFVKLIWKYTFAIIFAFSPILIIFFIMALVGII